MQLMATRFLVDEQMQDMLQQDAEDVETKIREEADALKSIGRGSITSPITGAADVVDTGKMLPELDEKVKSFFPMYSGIEGAFEELSNLGISRENAVDLIRKSTNNKIDLKGDTGEFIGEFISPVAATKAVGAIASSAAKYGTKAAESVSRIAGEAKKLFSDAGGFDDLAVATAGSPSAQTAKILDSPELPDTSVTKIIIGSSGRDYEKKSKAYESAKKELSPFGSNDAPVSDSEAQELWNRTGAQQDLVDNDIVYEIPTVNAKLKLTDPKSRYADSPFDYDAGRVTYNPQLKTTLSDILDFDELFEQAPYLKDIEIKKVSGISRLFGTKAGYNPADNTIFIADGTPQELTSDLLHEVEHAVQNADGKRFDGGNFNRIMRQDPEFKKLGGQAGINTLNQRKRDILDKYAPFVSGDLEAGVKREEVRNFLDIYGTLPEPNRFIKEVKKLSTNKDSKHGAGTFSYLSDIREWMEKNFPDVEYEYESQMGDTIAYIKTASEKDLKNIIKDYRKNNLEGLERYKKIKERAILKYMRDPGEVTARNVQFRFKLSQADPSITRVAPRFTEDKAASPLQVPDVRDGKIDQPRRESQRYSDPEVLRDKARELGVELSDDNVLPIAEGQRYYLASKAEQGGDTAQSLAEQTSDAFTEFATPLRTTGRGPEKKLVAKDKPIMRVQESIEESLSPRMKRAMDVENFPEAASILPAPGRFFDPARRDYKEGMAKGLAKAGIELDLEFGNYIMMGKGKPTDVSNETFENLFISPRTSFKRSQGTNTSTARANQFAENLSIEDMKKNYKQNTGKEGKEINTNLLQPERFKVISNNEERLLDHPIIAVQPKSGKHYYTLDTQFVGPVNMKRMTDKVRRKLKSGEIKEEVPQPNLRPATVGDVRLGNVVGEIKVGSKTHSLYDYIEVDAVPSFSKGKSNIEKFNKGGAVPMNIMTKQMELFDEGGLMDEGGTVDPVSGNEVPPGSTQEEVRDDVPAQLSEGEFVFPADVVRYIGLETLMRMRQEAKMGLAQMEAMGQMGNSEEAIMPDDLPFDMYDLEVEDDGLEMQVGGSVPAAPTPTSNAMSGTPTSTVGGFVNQIQPLGGALSNLGVAPTPLTAASATQVDPNLQGTQFTPTSINPVTPTFQQQIGAGVVGVDYEFVEYTNEAGQTIRLRRNKATGQMIDPIPEGFSEEVKEEEVVETTPTTGVGTQTTRVADDGGRGEGEGDMSPTGATLSFGGTKGRRSSGFGGDEVLGSISGSLSFGTTTTDPVTGVVSQDLLSNPYGFTQQLAGSALDVISGGKAGQPLSLKDNQLGILNGDKKGLRMDGNLITNATITFTPEVYNSVVTRKGKSKVTTRQELANTVKSIGSLYGKNYDGEMTYKEAKDLADVFSDGKGNVDVETLEKTYGDDFIDRMNTDSQFAKEVGRAMDETANGLKGMTQAEKDRFKGLMDGSISPDTGPDGKPSAPTAPGGGVDFTETSQPYGGMYAEDRGGREDSGLGPSSDTDRGARGEGQAAPARAKGGLIDQQMKRSGLASKK